MYRNSVDDKNKTVQLYILTKESSGIERMVRCIYHRWQQLTR